MWNENCENVDYWQNGSEVEKGRLLQVPLGYLGLKYFVTELSSEFGYHHCRLCSIQALKLPF